MPKDKARSLAKQLKKEHPEFDYKAKWQNWRTGHHWYVKRSDGAGIF